MCLRMCELVLAGISMLADVARTKSSLSFKSDAHYRDEMRKNYTFYSRLINSS